MGLKKDSSVDIDEVGSIFLKEKPTRALVLIAAAPADELSDEDPRMYSGELADKIDSTYAHTVDIVSMLEEKGLVVKDYNGGRIKYLEPTEKGLRVAKAMVNLSDTLAEVYRDE